MLIKFETLTSNAESTYRKETLGGRKYLVVPVTMIVPGVLNGSQGSIKYVKAENDKSVKKWNGMPITEGHPKVNGQSVSARSPEVLNKFQHGIILNAKSEENLTAEAWIDIENSKRINPRVVWSVVNGKPIEVSTGLELVLATNDKGESVATDYSPDHLAILVDTVGACSLKDGCGLGVENEIGHHALGSVLIDLLNKRFSISSGLDHNFYIDEVFNDHVIYNKDGNLYRLNYSVSDEDDVVLAEDPVKVDRRVSYVQVSNARKENEMKKEQLIGLIINSSCDCWGEEDREVLNGFEVEKLQKIHNGITANEKNKQVAEAVANFSSDDTDVEYKDGAIVVNQKGGDPTPTIDEAKLVETVTNAVQEQFMNKYGSDIDFAQKTRKEQRDAVINSLCGKDDPRREIFEKMDDESLKVMAENAAKKSPSTPAAQTTFYGGQSGPAPSGPVINEFDNDDTLQPVGSISFN